MVRMEAQNAETVAGIGKEIATGRMLLTISVYLPPTLKKSL